MSIYTPPTIFWLMQAVSSSNGDLITWQSTPHPDWSGIGFPGPGSPEYIAATRVRGKSTPGSLFDPTTDGTGLAEFYVAPHYSLITSPTNTGTWTATVGSDLARTDTNAPARDQNGSPIFDGTTTAQLRNADQMGVWLSYGDCYQLAVVDLAAINTVGLGTPWYQEAVWSDAENGVSFLSFRKQAGPTYFADFGLYDSQPRIASVEITSLVNASGAGRVVFQTKRSGGYVWIRAGDGLWVRGDAMSAPNSFQTNTLVAGSNYSGSVILQGTIRAIGLYTAAQIDASFADHVNAWGLAL